MTLLVPKKRLPRLASIYTVYTSQERSFGKKHIENRGRSMRLPTGLNEIALLSRRLGQIKYAVPYFDSRGVTQTILPQLPFTLHET